MKGHVEPAGVGRHKLVIELGTGPDGKRRRTVRYIHGGKRKADAELVRLLRELETGQFVEPHRLTVGEYLRQWLATTQPKVEPKTYAFYREAIEVHLIPGLGHHALQKLSPLHLEAYYAQARTHGRRDGRGGLGPRTVLHHHRILREALGQAVRWRQLHHNPAEAVEPPRAPHAEAEPLAPEDLAALLAAVRGTRLYLPVLLALATGARRGEVLGLVWECVDLDRAELVIRRTLQQAGGEVYFTDTKSHRQRRVPLSPILLEALREEQARQAERRSLLGADYDDLGLVVCHEDGSRWSPQALSHAFAAQARKLGIRVTFHGLRHQHASLLFEEGVEPKVVSERLGHSGIGITLDLYTHLLPQQHRSAAAATETALRRVIAGAGLVPESVPGTERGSEGRVETEESRA